MASYPAFDQLLGSTHTPFDDLTIDRAIDGSAKGRRFYTTRKDRFMLKHLLTLAQRDTLLAFYDANWTLAIDFVWDGDRETYSNMLFSDVPKFTYLGGGRIAAEVSLEAQ